MTLRAAVRARLIDQLGDELADRVWADEVPEDAAYPFVQLTLAAGTETPRLYGDGRTVAWDQSLSVHLWQTLAAEDLELRDRVIAALDGWNPAKTDGRRIHVVSRARVVDPQYPAVQWVIDVRSVK